MHPMFIPVVSDAKTFFAGLVHRLCIPMYSFVPDDHVNTERTKQSVGEA